MSLIFSSFFITGFAKATRRTLRRKENCQIYLSTSGCIEILSLQESKHITGCLNSILDNLTG